MVWQSAELSGDANPARVPSQSAHYLNWWRNESSDIAEFYYAMVGSFIETQKSNPSGPRPSDPSAFSNRRFHSIFKPALTNTEYCKGRGPHDGREKTWEDLAEECLAKE